MKIQIPHRTLLAFVAVLFLFFNTSALFSQTWLTTGNGNLSPNCFIGSSNLQPVVFKTNNIEALRLEPASGEVQISTLSGTSSRFVMTDSTGKLFSGPPLRQSDPGMDSLFDCETILWNGDGNNVTPYCRIGTLNNSPFRMITLGWERARISEVGNFGIGTLNPKSLLHVGTVEPVTIMMGAIGFNLYPNGATMLYATNGPAGLLKLDAVTGVLRIATAPAGTTGANVNAVGGIYVAPNGNVGINSASPTAAFYVNGDMKANGLICSHEARVSLQGAPCWPDYVFEEDYQLISLVDLKKYIEENGHLPGVPSASEVEKEGVNLGENQAALLKKIEELTLYVMELEERMKVIEEGNE